MNSEHVGNFHEVGIADWVDWAGRVVVADNCEEVGHMRCMLLLVVHSSQLVLAVAKQWLVRRWLTWQFVSGYQRGLAGGILFVM